MYTIGGLVSSEALPCPMLRARQCSVLPRAPKAPSTRSSKLVIHQLVIQPRQAGAGTPSARREHGLRSAAAVQPLGTSHSS